MIERCGWAFLQDLVYYASYRPGVTVSKACQHFHRTKAWEVRSMEPDELHQIIEDFPELFHLHHDKVYVKEPTEHFPSCPVECGRRCDCVLEMSPLVSPQAEQPNAEMMRS